MKQIAIIGLGTFGQNLVRFLSQQKCEVIAIDNNEEKIRDISEEVSQVIQADASDEKALKELDIASMDVVVICIGQNIEESVLIAMLLKDLGVKYIISKAVNELHARVLRHIGVDKVVFPERDMAQQIANTLVSSNLLYSIEVSPDYQLIEIKAPKKITGMTLNEAQIRSKFGITIVSLKRKVPYVTEDGQTDFTEKINISPKADDEILEGDILLVVGKHSEIQKLKDL